MYGKYKKFLGNGCVLSIDNVVVDYKLEKDGGQKLLNFIQTRVLWQFDYQERFGGIGKFKYCFTFDFGQESTVTVMIGLFGSTGALEGDRVRFDFNPNKVHSDCEELSELLQFVLLHAKFSDLVRYDLAYDMPYERRDFMLLRNDPRKRGFEELSQDNYTEYLGRRNCPGRYKLYNKSLESKLPFDCTRSELTCSGAWSYQDVLKHFPTVYRFDKENLVNLKLNDVDDLKVLSMVLIRHPEEAYLADWLNWRKKKSLRSILAQCSADLSSVHDVLTVDDVQAVVSLLRDDILT